MKKKFDAVMFQRKAREELGKKYVENREAFLKDLKERYGNLRKKRVGHTLQIASAQRSKNS